MTRIHKLRLAFGWSQIRMAEYLGLSQSRISHLETGAEESGPVKRLLDQLESTSVASSGGGEVSEAVDGL